MKIVNSHPVIAWFSCGCVSAIACYMAITKFNFVRLYYIDTGQEHPDNIRFLHQCEEWYQLPIRVIKNEKFADAFDVCKKTRYLNGPSGARCTLELKKKMRWKIEDELGAWHAQVFGFDATEERRAKRFSEQYPEAKAIFPVLDAKLTKQECLALLKKHNIGIPMMYKLGYRNNNCIGCVKGGIGYWARIRKDFPMHFARMASLERSIGHSCINGCYLDELPADAALLPPIVPSCSLFCDPEFMDI